MNNPIKLAAWAAIVNILLLIPVGYISLMSGMGKLDPGLNGVYIFILLVSGILYTATMNGFRVIGEKLSSNLLVVSAYLQIGLEIMVTLIEILQIGSPGNGDMILDLIVVVLLGGTTISFGVALVHLKQRFGSSANVAGILNIVAGSLMITVILALPALMVAVVAVIFEATLLFEATKELETNAPVIVE